MVGLFNKERKLLKLEYPNYFKDQKHITKDTELKDYYYEVYGKNNCVFRISFKKLV